MTSSPKVAILAGGRGTRMGPFTDRTPKPMVKIGKRPILWHIMRYYAHFGFDEFVVALGYRSQTIKRYWSNPALRSSALSVDLSDDSIRIHETTADDWTVTLVDTGRGTTKAERIRQLAPYLNGETFFLTWGDGLADVDLHELLAFHRDHGRLATLTAVHPPAKFGHLELDGDRVKKFEEKPDRTGGWINGAFFVLQPEVLEHIPPGEARWEEDVLSDLAGAGELNAYRHTSFWQCMDTPKERARLESYLESGRAPWTVWRNESPPDDTSETPADVISPRASSA